MSGEFNPDLRASLCRSYRTPEMQKLIAKDEQEETEAMRQLRGLSPGQLAKVMQEAMSTIGIGEQGTRSFTKAFLQIGMNRVLSQLVEQAFDPTFE